jgi:hypothetical protein
MDCMLSVMGTTVSVSVMDVPLVTYSQVITLWVCWVSAEVLDTRLIRGRLNLLLFQFFSRVMRKLQFPEGGIEPMTFTNMQERLIYTKYLNSKFCTC